jgi:hypothetical protein
MPMVSDLTRAARVVMVRSNNGGERLIALVEGGHGHPPKGLSEVVGAAARLSARFASGPEIAGLV